MRYRPELDGLRALAVLAVLASHTELTFTGGGWLGVDLFFVLSGFLITSLMIQEHGSSGSISLRRFYLRRILRLYPALVVVLLAGACFYRILGDGGTLVGYGRTVAISGFYLEDLFYGITHSTFGGFGHTWSLAVEEQFYLIWPPIFVWAASRRRGNPLVWAATGAVVCWIICAILSLHADPDGIPDAASYLPWSRFSQILAGCALAFIIRRGTSLPRALKTAGGGYVTAVLIVGLVLTAAKVPRSPNLGWEAPVIAVLGCALIWHLTAADRSPLRGALGVAPLVWLGRRSYGVYLIHVPVLEVLEAHLHVRRLEVCGVMLVTTFALAALSYRFVELPFLRMKKRLRPVSIT